MRRLRLLMAVILLGPACFAEELLAGEITITRPSPGLFEVGGGSGSSEWKIRYGSQHQFNVLSIAGPGNTAYFSHQNWLRRVDVEKGIVTGRWRFPLYRISALRWQDDRLQVETEDLSASLGGSVRRTIDFDPDAPAIPNWPTGSLLNSRLPQFEAFKTGTLLPVQGILAAAFLPDAENAARRDPFSPLLRFYVGHLYRALARPEAGRLFAESVRLESAHFYELFAISAYLDTQSEPELAREAFERGYEQFWKNGFDPRLVATLLARLITYNPEREVSEPARAENTERAYRLGPWTEAADVAWRVYSGIMAGRGRPDEAELWRMRADEADRNSLVRPVWALATAVDAAMLLVLAVALAAIIFFTVLFFRYRPQRKIHRAAETRWFISRGITFFNAEYWNRKDRLAFATIVLAWWLAWGLGGSFLSGLFRMNSADINLGIGNLGGPVTIAFYENALPASPERDLLLAMAYQHDGQLERAEKLYRNLPDFAESWNNLGVILQDTGRNAEAEEAFQQALVRSPGMPESEFNLGMPPQNLWAELHQKYVPGRAMFAVSRPERIVPAILGGSMLESALQAWKGPTIPLRSNQFALQTTGTAIVVVICLAGILVTLLPARDVTQPAHKSQSVLELLFPGTAPEWRYGGGLVLVAFTYALVSTWAFIGDRHLFRPPIPNMRAFAVPASPEAVRNVTETSMVLFYIAMAALWAANAALIWYSRRRRITRA